MVVGRLIAGVAWLALAQTMHLLQAQDADAIPEPVVAGDFESLRENPPFLRVLRAGDTYALRGVAEIGDAVFAVIANRETEETFLVGEEPNDEGIRLVEIEDKSLGPISVTVSIGGQLAELPLEAREISFRKLPAGWQIRYDSRGRAMPPQQLMDKYRSMTESQRQEYRRWRDRYLKAHPDQHYSAKRYPFSNEAMDAIMAGKEPPEP